MNNISVNYTNEDGKENYLTGETGKKITAGQGFAIIDKDDDNPTSPGEDPTDNSQTNPDENSTDNNNPTDRTDENGDDNGTSDRPVADTDVTNNTGANINNQISADDGAKAPTTDSPVVVPSTPTAKGNASTNADKSAQNQNTSKRSSIANAVDTADPTEMGLIVGILALSGLGVGFIIYKKHKSRHRHNS